MIPKSQSCSNPSRWNGCLLVKGLTSVSELSSFPGSYWKRCKSGGRQRWALGHSKQVQWLPEYWPSALIRDFRFIHVWISTRIILTSLNWEDTLCRTTRHRMFCVKNRGRDIEESNVSWGMKETYVPHQELLDLWLREGYVLLNLEHLPQEPVMDCWWACWQSRKSCSESWNDWTNLGWRHYFHAHLIRVVLLGNRHGFVLKADCGVRSDYPFTRKPRRGCFPAGSTHSGPWQWNYFS